MRRKLVPDTRDAILKPQLFSLRNNRIQSGTQSVKDTSQNIFVLCRGHQELLDLRRVFTTTLTFSKTETTGFRYISFLLKNFSMSMMLAIHGRIHTQLLHQDLPFCMCVSNSCKKHISEAYKKPKLGQATHSTVPVIILVLMENKA